MSVTPNKIKKKKWKNKLIYIYIPNLHSQLTTKEDKFLWLTKGENETNRTAA
jgi:hypothetical protein